MNIAANSTIRRCSQQLRKLSCSAVKIQPNSNKNRVVFSGIQPSGVPHVGNYFGAINNWKQLQDAPNMSCIFSIVDLHSITVNAGNTGKIDCDALRDRIEVMTASLLAVGLDPQKCALYLQSMVPEHGQLCWMLSCMLTTNRLYHFPQFKEKTLGLKETPLGLYLYPALQAADVLLYRGTDVPVGEDQLPHLHLVRDVAEMFNKRYTKYFPLPEVLMSESSARLRDLRDPTKKMSKSATDPKGRIDLTDSPDQIRAKIKKAVTDFTSEVTYDPENRVGVATLVELHSLSEGITPLEASEAARGLSTGQYKAMVADALIAHLSPIRQRINDLLQNRDYLWDVLEEGADRIRPIAWETLSECRRLMGMRNNKEYSKKTGLHVVRN